MGGWIDLKPDHIAQFVDELGIGGQLELPHPVRLQPVRSPDALHRTDADPGLFCHHRCGPVRGFTGRLAQRQVDDAFGHFRTQRRNARPPRLVAQQAVKTLFHETLLPAPDAGLGLSGLAHDRVGAHAIGRQILSTSLLPFSCFFLAATLFVLRRIPPSNSDRKNS